MVEKGHVKIKANVSDVSAVMVSNSFGKISKDAKYLEKKR